MGADIVADSPHKGSDVFRQGICAGASGRDDGWLECGSAIHFQEAPDFIVVAHECEIKDLAFNHFENQAGVKARAAFKIGWCQFTNAAARVEVRLTPSCYRSINCLTEVAALLKIECSKMLPKGRVDLNP